MNQDNFFKKFIISTAGVVLTIFIMIIYNAITTYNSVILLERSLESTNEKLSLYINRFYDLKADLAKNSSYIDDISKQIERNNSVVLGKITDLNTTVLNQKDRLTRTNNRQAKFYMLILDKYFKNENY